MMDFSYLAVLDTVAGPGLRDFMYLKYPAYGTYTHDNGMNEEYYGCPVCEVVFTAFEAEDREILAHGFDGNEFYTVRLLFTTAECPDGHEFKTYQSVTCR